jgi:hypothetical protein
MTTLKELVEAFKTGRLDKSYYIMIDKSGNSLTLCQLGPEETENERYEKCQRLFQWNREKCCIDELFELVGIRAEWA